MSIARNYSQQLMFALRRNGKKQIFFAGKMVIGSDCRKLSKVYICVLLGIMDRGVIHLDEARGLRFHTNFYSDREIVNEATAA